MDSGWLLDGGLVWVTLCVGLGLMKRMIVMGRLVPCRTCKHMVDSRAKLCPGCGAKDPWLTPKLEVAAFGIVVAVFVFGYVACSESPEDVAACRKDLNCISNKQMLSAKFDCREAIEKSTHRRISWLDNEITFDSAVWGNPPDTIIYRGSNATTVTSAGEVDQALYNCHWNPATETVIKAELLGFTK